MEEVVSKKKKRLKIFKVVLLTLFLVFVLEFCFIHIYLPNKSRVLSDDEHIERISKKIKSKYIDKENSKYTSFEIYPVYDNNDELRYAVIEFQPEGFVYIRINKEMLFNNDRFLSKFSLLSMGMYRKSFGSSWGFCSIDPTKKDAKQYSEKIIYKNEERYNNSPYYVNNIIGEKRYLISVKIYKKGDGYENETILIPCVIRDGEYLNLFSNEKFHVINDYANVEQAVSYDIKFFACSENNL